MKIWFFFHTWMLKQRSTWIFTLLLFQVILEWHKTVFKLLFILLLLFHFSPFASLLVISTLVYSLWGLSFFRLPDKFPEESRVLVVDPMLATGTILMAGAPTIMFSDGTILWLGGEGGGGVWRGNSPPIFLYINEN